MRSKGAGYGLCGKTVSISVDFPTNFHKNLRNSADYEIPKNFRNRGNRNSAELRKNPRAEQGKKLIKVVFYASNQLRVTKIKNDR